MLPVTSRELCATLYIRGFSKAKRACPGLKSTGTGPPCVGDPCAGRRHLLLKMTGARVFLATPATQLAVTLHGSYLAM